MTLRIRASGTRDFSTPRAVALSILLVSCTSAAFAETPGSILYWSGYLQPLPGPNSGFIEIDATRSHCIALRENGSLDAFGNNYWGQCDVPPGTGYIDIAAGDSHSLALRADGSGVGWGKDDFGESTDWPQPNTGFLAVAAGSEVSIALDAQGTIHAWGRTYEGMADVPEPNVGYVAMDCGATHALALRQDGSVVAWGGNTYGQLNIPSQNEDFVAVAASFGTSVALKSDGSIVIWGHRNFGEGLIPEPNEDFVSIEVGEHHILGMKSDGRLLGWGLNDWGQTDIPEDLPHLEAYTGGARFTIGLAAVEPSGVDGEAPVVSDAAPSVRVIPNPIKAMASISYRLTQPGPVEMEIFDAEGRLVRVLSRNDDVAGESTVVWDGRDDRGFNVSNGVYMLKLRSAESVLSHRMVVLR
ncbi:MAG: T9SS type A sorting domain-containing protein [Candidatus Eisenbacteria bacterium]|uniref:T9SS type A sorting domain-containing protein n=1 Tax=Eiseniibacteriota bacterium TaxID=2212470 RepID=A0A956NG62_UNCEI|nr:T9SS type A sorting domain-containing protein [Candidatus Eisenbacteria bacterium]MCB9462156.1 T9SS type A sorting domain-containing protein [Candidatus Eisenbacteria bacterium]